MDLGRSNHTIVKRIITKWSLDENRRSDTSRYRETKKLIVASTGGKTTTNRRKIGTKPIKQKS